MPFFQEPPRLGNQFDDDPLLPSWLARHLPADQQAAVTSERVGLGLALLVAHGGAFVVALLLIAWREHSAGMPTLRLWRVAPVRA